MRKNALKHVWDVAQPEKQTSQHLWPLLALQNGKSFGVWLGNGKSERVSIAEDEIRQALLSQVTERHAMSNQGLQTKKSRRWEGWQMVYEVIA